jgi:5-methylcytosine-specific restriction endonuclease McrA
MSRARSITLPCGNVVWFDVNKNGKVATAEQLELLATIETDCELDDLLDEALTQGDIITRLRKALGADPIPAAVLEKRQKWRAERQTQPECRMCGKIGDSTKHHFVNKWILRELEHYQQVWADRQKNTIPLCIECHRDTHSRDNGPVSIVPFLTEREKAFANAALQALADERPKLLILIARGDDSVYEARLAKDWIEGLFEPADGAVVEYVHDAVEAAA